MVSEADDQACLEYLEAMFLSGQRKDFIHHGTETNGLASVRVQLQGNRVVVMALADEILAHVQSLDPQALQKLHVCTPCFVPRGYCQFVLLLLFGLT